MIKMQFTNKNSKSTFLVRLIGIADICTPTAHLENKDIPSFLHIAEQNKIPLLFLKTVACNTKNHNIQHILSQYEEQHKNTLELIASTGNLLEKIGMQYTFFKTLKPFPYTPSDVDVLLWSDNSLKTVAKALKNQGCISLEKNAYGVTMFSPKHKMNIDLTTQIAVSGLIYMNKKLLFNHLCKVEVNEKTVQTLKPSADLLVVAAHSIFKEQTYTLSDYYTVVMFTEYWREATKLAEKFHLKQAFDMALKMAKEVTMNAFGSRSVLMRKFMEVGVVNVVESDEKFELPKKYDLTTLMVAFLKKVLEDPVSKQSLPFMAQAVSNPAFYRRIIAHARRKTY